MATLDDVVAELDGLRSEVSRNLQGWFDDKEGKWNVGLVGRLDGLGEELHGLRDEVFRNLQGWHDDKGGGWNEGMVGTVETVANKLTDICGVLYEIEGHLKDANASNESVLGELRSNLTTINHALAELRATVGLCFWPSILTFLGIIALLGTLRNWF